MATNSNFSTVEDVPTPVTHDFMREVAITDSGYTEITVANRCFGVEVWDKAGGSALIVRHQSASDTYEETVPAGTRFRKNLDVEHNRFAEDDPNAMRPGAVIGYFKSPSGALTLSVKEITDAS